MEEIIKVIPRKVIKERKITQYKDIRGGIHNFKTDCINADNKYRNEDILHKNLKILTQISFSINEAIRVFKVNVLKKLNFSNNYIHLAENEYYIDKYIGDQMNKPGIYYIIFEFCGVGYDHDREYDCEAYTEKKYKELINTLLI